MPNEYQLYNELAGWWPLISPPSEYVEEAAFFAEVLGRASHPVRSVLELGSGGGNNAAHLKSRFTMTLVELSENMLAISRRLNPECVHHAGDMRTIRLDETFDAIFVHDAIGYMLTESELRQAVDTAFAHCHPGGLAVFVPDDVAETFEPYTEHGGSDDADRGARFLAWSWDPDVEDTVIQTEYVFLLHAPESGTTVVHETHRTGLFSREAWRQILRDAGFRVDVVTERNTEDRPPREVFLGTRPPC
ncbi:class I SAM-dependent methyltransferase [Phytoactinopolyspora halophila]|nr:class I SAM-dependent methyltransferase [Phytoactinopolyspora halophila]